MAKRSNTKNWRNLQLNALRAFEAAARHQSFTKAADELAVTPGAISHHIKGLEERLGLQLFRRLPQGLINTEAAERLLPALQTSFDGIAGALEELYAVDERPTVQISAVNTLAVGWLMSRLCKFRSLHPEINLEMSTHNNWRVSELAEVDILSRFGGGDWRGTESIRVAGGTASPLCAPELAVQLREPSDLKGVPLLRTFHHGDWTQWFEAAGILIDELTFDFTFDTSLSMVAAARAGYGVAIASPDLFEVDLAAGTLVQPFPLAVATEGAHYLTRISDGRATAACDTLWFWLAEQAPR